MEYLDSLLEWGMWSALITIIATALIYQVSKHRLEQDEIGKYFVIGCLYTAIFIILMIFGLVMVVDEVVSTSGDFI